MANTNTTRALPAKQARPVPADRKTKKRSPEDEGPPPGSELLKSLSDIPIWDQRALVKAFRGMMDNDIAEGASEEDISGDQAVAMVEAMMDMAEALIPFAHEPEKWVKFCSGNQADVMERLVPVVTWVMTESGNS